MSVMNVVLYPNAPLTDVALPVTEFGPALERLVADMFDTMDAYDGVGLAAPQVGVAKRLFVMQAPEGEPMALVNPEILESDGREDGEEGCLSLPQVYTAVPRAAWIRVRAQDIDGTAVEFEARDFDARIIQHELDHLNGVIFLDRVDILTRQTKLAEWDEVRSRMAASAKQG